MCVIRRNVRFNAWLRLMQESDIAADPSRDMDMVHEFYTAYRDYVRGLEMDPENNKEELGKAWKTERVLMEVTEGLSQAVTGSERKQVQQEIREDKMAAAAKTQIFTRQNFNMIDLDAPIPTDAPLWKRRVGGAIALLHDLRGVPNRGRFKDMLHYLQFVFGFQEDNVRNQREHIVLLLANSRTYDEKGTPIAASMSDDAAAMNLALDSVSSKVLGNFLRWAQYLHVDILYFTAEHRMLHTCLFLLIWGEAANVRFLPECLCYLFHQMASELAGMMQKTAAEHSRMMGTGGEYAFLNNVITPFYRILKQESDYAGHGSDAKGHPAWRNYDDFNEFFWSKRCFELGWPIRTSHVFFKPPPVKSKDPGKKMETPKTVTGEDFSSKSRLSKTLFVEWRSFLHLYRGFDRMWAFLLLMFQGMAIVAFSGQDGSTTLMKVLSVVPMAAILRFFQVLFDILLSFGAYRSMSVQTISRKFLRLAVLGAWGGFLSFFLIMYFISGFDTSSPYRPLFLMLSAIYVIPAVVLSLLMRFVTPLRSQLDRVSHHRFFQFVKWFYQVGGGSISYYFQILPLVGPTRYIIGFKHLKYRWKDLVSASNYNALTLLSIWAPVFVIYLIDAQIWYTVLSAILSTLIGAWWHLGEIRTLSMLRARFRSFPAAFMNTVHHQNKFNRTRSTSLRSSARFQPLGSQQPASGSELLLSSRREACKFAIAWNEIIRLLREEDYLSDREYDLLIMPALPSNVTVVQWPLFLLANQILLAVGEASGRKESQSTVWRKVTGDEYMRCAVLEAYQSLRPFLLSIVEPSRTAPTTGTAAAATQEAGSGVYEARIISRLFDDLEVEGNNGSLLTTFRFSALPVILDRLSKLTAIQDQNEMTQRAAVQALQALYDTVKFDFLSPDHRASLEDVSGKPQSYCLFAAVAWPANRAAVKRLHLLLTIKESAMDVPHNLEARRRLQFFTNSLHMRMPDAPKVADTLPFCVMTPYYSEIVTYSMAELVKPNEDGISTLFYLQKIFPDEWANFLQRVGMGEKELEVRLRAKDDIKELRMWASYRGQTLARTVRGMMYYHRALRLLAYMETPNSTDLELGADGLPLDPADRLYLAKVEPKELADVKFTYVVTCQIYGKQKADKDQRAADIFNLMKEHEALRVAYIDEVVTLPADPSRPDARPKTEYFSRLVKVDTFGSEQDIYKVKLPGPAKLGEGKPENQNHAIIFTRGEALQTIDMNQDNYFEETLKMRNLLQEFAKKHGLRKPSILGVREHIFTGSVSSLAWFMSNQETSFVTLGQRFLAIPLKVRMHYGHPDVFDRLFHITRGGMSKASKTINISEDIFAGFNTTLRQGNVTHHEYIQVGKGRDVGLNQIALFEAKVASGNGEQVLSRDICRLGQLFDFYRLLSFYFTSVGFFLCTALTSFCAFLFLYGRVYLSLSGVGATLSSQSESVANLALESAINTQFLIQAGFFTAVPMIMGFILEQGFLRAVVSFITMQLQLASVFFTFSLGTRAHYFLRTLLHGGAKYRATGRGFVVRHIKFADNYRLYSRSHFTYGIEAIMLLTVYMLYGGSSSSLVYLLITVSSWFLALSWCYAPYIFNPAGFEWQKTVADFEDWVEWLWYKGGVGVKGEQSWESWWEEETEHVRSIRSRIIQVVLNLRFFFVPYGIVYQLNVAQGNTSILVYAYAWIIFVVVALVFWSFIHLNHSLSPCKKLAAFLSIHNHPPHSSPPSLPSPSPSILFRPAFFSPSPTHQVFNFSRAWEAQLPIRLLQITVAVLFVTSIACSPRYFLPPLPILASPSSPPDHPPPFGTLPRSFFSPTFLLQFLPLMFACTSYLTSVRIWIVTVRQVIIALRPVHNKRLWWWRQVRTLARVYDAIMGGMIFLPVAVLSWFPFFSTFQTRLVFNQAFSRGLEISLILAGKPSDAAA
ncbi:unnamed protein product [Closterium sp. Naga37s-1]|nr:unnamed protein product [Closterium sp. Naga37s-1]